MNGSDVSDALWRAHAAAAGSTWFSPELQRGVMPALGASVEYLPDPDGSDGIVWQSFARGPFRLGYVGFPLGGTLRGATVGPARIARLLASPSGRRLHVLRVIGSAFNAPEELAGHAEHLPETKVVALAEFDPLANGSIRRNVNKARRLGVEVKPVTDAALADAMYDAYARMVVGHGGVTKYTRGYFAQLAEAARESPRLRVLVATVESRFAGFLAAVFEQTQGYYLHSAVSGEFRQHRATDLLMLTVLEEARAAGLSGFNFLASPPTQPNLVRFKEKWGGTTALQTVHELRPQPLMAAFIRAGTAVLGHLRGLRAAESRDDD